ncbi:MAG: hypothetical protein SXQ77_01715, partial [Halobacteria archaeon]|nr:hypothetical protein [Halobacteria archaeon]
LSPHLRKLFFWKRSRLSDENWRRVGRSAGGGVLARTSRTMSEIGRVSVVDVRETQRARVSENSRTVMMIGFLISVM